MSLYSYKGRIPTELPFRIRLESGETRTSLYQLSNEKLKDLGFIGPIDMPIYDKDNQKIEWNSINCQYSVVDMTDDEIQNIKDSSRAENLSKIDYNYFTKRLITTEFYNKLRKSSLESLVANTICTELLVLLNSSQFGDSNSSMIQHYINAIFLTFQFNESELKELKEVMAQTKMDYLYTIPDENFIQNASYDPQTNGITPPSPYPSWTLVDGMWVSQVPYPNDGNNYQWNEDSLEWTLI